MPTSPFYVPTCQWTCQSTYQPAKGVWLCNLTCPRVNLACTRCKRGDNFSTFPAKIRINFLTIFQKNLSILLSEVYFTFANFKNIWEILKHLARETKNLIFNICKIWLTKNLITLKPLKSFSMEHVGLTRQSFGSCKMELNIFVYLPNFIRRV